MPELSVSAIIAMLRDHEAELRSFGLNRLSLFGSYARGQADEESDIDLLTTLDETKKLSLLDLIHIENHLADMLGRSVDLIDDKSIDPRIKPSVERSMLHVF